MSRVGPVVLKVSSQPDGEAEGLRRFASSGLTPLLLDREDDVLLIEFLDGETLSDRPWSAADHQAVGAALRQLVFSPRPDDLSFRDDDAAWLDGLVEHLPQSLAVLHAELRALIFSNRSAFTHSDMHPGNVLLRDDGAVRIIDPFGRLGPAAFDLAHHAQRACIQKGAPQPSVTLAALLAGWGEPPPPLLPECQWLLLLWRIGGFRQAGHPSDLAPLRRALVDAHFPLLAEAEAALAV
jgi:hypothetical protein